MFRKLAVALIAASVFTAPAFAQSTTPAKKDAPAATTPAVHATPSVKHAKRVVHHVRHVKHVKHIKHAKHVTHVKKPKHHKVAKITRKGATYMRAVPAHHPVMKTRKPAKHTIKTTHRVKHVRFAQKSTTRARSDAPAAPKSVN